MVPSEGASGMPPALTWASTYCFVAACRFAVGLALSVRKPVITSPDLSTLLAVAATAVLAAAWAASAAACASAAAAAALLPGTAGRNCSLSACGIVSLSRRVGYDVTLMRRPLHPRQAIDQRIVDG